MRPPLHVSFGTIDEDDLARERIRPPRHIFWGEGVDWVQKIAAGGVGGLPRFQDGGSGGLPEPECPRRIRSPR